MIIRFLQQPINGDRAFFARFLKFRQINVREFNFSDFSEIGLSKIVSPSSITLIILKMSVYYDQTNLT